MTRSGPGCSISAPTCTSIRIVVGVALDTVKQLKAQLMMRNYEGFRR